MPYIKRKIWVPDGYEYHWKNWWKYEYWKFGWGMICGLLIAFILSLLKEAF